MSNIITWHNLQLHDDHKLGSAPPPPSTHCIETAVYRYQKNTAAVKVTALSTVGLLNTVRSILRKSLHAQMRSAAGNQRKLKLQHKCQQHEIHVQRQKVYIYSNIINTHCYGKENRREHCNRFARLDFCRSCLQLMTSRNTAVYRHHGIFETVYYCPRIPTTE